MEKEEEIGVLDLSFVSGCSGRVCFHCTPQLRSYLADLQSMGLWGDDADEIARRLTEWAVRQLIMDGTLRQRRDSLKLL